MTEADNDQLRLQELEALDEKRLQAQQRIELYQARISRAFKKKVKQWVVGCQKIIEDTTESKSWPKKQDKSSFKKPHQTELSMLSENY